MILKTSTLCSAKVLNQEDSKFAMLAKLPCFARCKNVIFFTSYASDLAVYGQICGKRFHTLF
jgi:hypothetical protein